MHLGHRTPQIPPLSLRSASLIQSKLAKNGVESMTLHMDSANLTTWTSNLHFIRIVPHKSIDKLFFPKKERDVVYFFLPSAYLASLHFFII